MIELNGLATRWVMATASAVLLVACGLMAPKAEQYVPPPLGTTWVTSVQTAGSYGSGSRQVPGRRGERMHQGAKVVEFEGSAGTIVANPNGDWIGIYRGQQPVITWDPPLHWEWPIEVGKSWTRAQRMTNHVTKRTMSYQVTQKVEAYEDVAVPAGTFKAFKVSTVKTHGDDNVLWFSPELGIFIKQMNRRTDKHPQGAGTQNIELLSYKRGD